MSLFIFLCSTGRRLRCTTVHTSPLDRREAMPLFKLPRSTGIRHSSATVHTRQMINDRLCHCSYYSVRQVESRVVLQFALIRYIGTVQSCATIHTPLLDKRQIVPLFIILRLIGDKLFHCSHSSARHVEGKVAPFLRTTDNIRYHCLQSCTRQVGDIVVPLYTLYRSTDGNLCHYSHTSAR